ncbi:hypothetical protein WR25_12862 [Diploscapter pachys]|uniref:Innexin n=1 Tax=Diploscapter pachys TaxID=2018661 RepID=A0A2A2LRE3_9BILA|nr:hypothetical protein WR25_12862 [Diploscapter pachys]
MIPVHNLEDVARRWFKPVPFDEPCDRMNYCWTTTIFLFLSIVSFWLQYSAAPIQCLVPENFAHSWEEAAEAFCFSTATYAVPLTERIPQTDKEKEEARIHYFQWVPFMLALQGLLFYLPSFIWTYQDKITGIDLKTAIEEAVNIKTMIRGDRVKEAQGLVRYLIDVLRIDDQEPLQNRSWSCWIWISLINGASLLSFLLSLMKVMGPMRERSTLQWIRRATRDRGDAIISADALKIFTHDVLRADGFLALALIEQHSGGIVASELACAIYQRYLELVSFLK